MTGNCKPDVEHLVASAEVATADPKRGRDCCKPAVRFKLGGAGGKCCNSASTNLEKVLKFAVCVRDRGGKDFQDSTLERRLIDTVRVPSAVGSGAPGVPGFRAAAGRCTAICSSAPELQGK